MSNKIEVDLERLQQAFESVRDRLLREQNSEGHWTGQLSTSPLSTATAVMALHQVVKGNPERSAELSPLIENGLAWLGEHQNGDGGWGDTLKSFSNISTTMLSHAVFHATEQSAKYAEVVERADRYITEMGGVAAVVKRYGKDKTFSVPILTHCALAGLVDWKEVSALPFELACLPHQFYATIRLPVVSYALPALIAIGQVRHHFRKPWNPLHSWLRNFSIPQSLRILKRTQPTTGGYLEAAPLTSFVTMSLAAKGLSTHPVVEDGVRFLKDSVLEDGSWPIDTNLATWVTTLSVNALGEELPEENREKILQWLLEQQYKEVHPFTQAAPGGWAWTNLSGGVPDADDTPGAMLAVLALSKEEASPEIQSALQNAARWLLDLQNRDGGWPTFCRGWGALPFDRSSADITAHCIRALERVKTLTPFTSEIESGIRAGFRFLDKQQRADGSWLPLWFGNQHAPEDINPVYGSAKVIAAYRDTGRIEALQAQDGLRWLREAQNEDGGWGGVQGAPSSVEETSLAVEALLSSDVATTEVARGVGWLIDRVESKTIDETTPIGFYFAKLWYFERLYPIIFSASALRKAKETCQGHSSNEN
ncbi:prenyltransferase/squalene oxidase repeat-containing protein [Thalassoglobus polymorphus]|nr:prenyltransferase/squalene oxidase repeat-containing protein [Thalassoglobus polymorphus]